jgi:hypothetical protein
MGDTHKVVSKDQWLAARVKLLAAEKEFTHARHHLSQQRRDLPWERVDKECVFDGPDGKETLAQPLSLASAAPRYCVPSRAFAAGNRRVRAALSHRSRSRIADGTIDAPSDRRSSRVSHSPSAIT